MNKQDAIEEAKKRFEHSNSLTEVHVTSDGECFLSDNLAKDYARKHLKEGERDVIAVTRDEAEGTVALAPAGDLILEINAASTVEAVESLLLPEDNRELVLYAAKERIEELQALEGGNQD